MRQLFGGKAVWITGGGSGIGEALALELGRHGAMVAVSGRRKDRLDAVVARLEALGARGLAVPLDVRDEAAQAAALAAVVGELGGLDVAVANAGFSVAGLVEEVSADEWRRQLDTNVVALATTARIALPELRRRNGRLALVGSVAGMICAPGYAPYHASKYAVRAIGQVLSMELHGSGTSCTTIHPGFVESDIARVDNQGVFVANRPDRRPAKLIWPADRAARVICRAIHRRRREFTFTGHGKAMGWLGRHAPGLVHFLLTRFGLERAARARKPRGE